MSSLDDKLISDWVSREVITQAQADTMQADLKAGKKANTSNKLIIALSTIGAVLLGIGAIMFIASNWQEIPRIGKQAIMIGSTFAALLTGFYLQYFKKNLPKVGASLIFLSALLFGATIALLGQMYHVPANASRLIFVWLIAILPLTYFAKTGPLAALTAVLSLLWAGLYTFNVRDPSSFDFEQSLIALPSLYLLLSITLFFLGSLHRLQPGLQKIARIFRLFGLKVALFVLFLFSFGYLSGAKGAFVIADVSELYSRVATALLLVAALAGTLIVLNAVLQKRNRTLLIQYSFGALLIILILIFIYFPVTTDLREKMYRASSPPFNGLISPYPIMFNLILAALISALIWTGYTKEDISLVNTGMGWLTALILVRYFDFFWDLFPRSIFFIVGGVILIAGGIYLERKRRDLKQEFASHATN